MSTERKEGVNLLNPETPAHSPEQGLELSGESPEFAATVTETPRVDQQHLANVKSTISASDPQPTEIAKDPSLTEIENILSENLGDIYSQLPESKREAFRVKGEEIAKTVQTMLQGAKVKTHKILQLVSSWLGMIPGVNLYFLRQEAKIKLDKLLDYQAEQAKLSSNDL
ncbi:MAG: hypothetical protein WAZ14_03895 [Patescibacteria group bacterium]